VVDTAVYTVLDYMGKIETRKYADRAEYLKRQVKARRKLLRKRLIEMFGGHCTLCGYNRYYGALHFHHKDPATKKFAINERELGKKWEVLVEEALKCVLLCGNCHAEVHAGIVEILG